MIKDTQTTHNAWEGFKTGRWTRHVDVREFIQLNFTGYQGDDSFLAGPTEATTKLWDQVMVLSKEERERGGIWDMDTKVPSTILSHDAGYLDESLEQIVGVQTDKPFKRSMQPFGGIRMAKAACEAYGYELDKETEHIFTEYRKTHNQGVFDAYSKEMLACRKAGIITGLPDAYGRGRIIGDYRRVALYGVDFLMAEKQKDFNDLSSTMTEDVIRLREEVSEQYRSLNELKQLGERYGFDLSRPAENFKEAVQWLYLAYLAAIKEQNGAAMSLGRTSTFLDIYAERDLQAGTITETEVQEIIDHFIMKLRLVKFARTPDYNALFSGDPTWVTESIGGVGIDGRAMVTKNSFRFLHSLDNLGPAPEPNLTVLWSTRLPENFKRYCTKMSIKTSSIQYENDDLMRESYGDDYGIACCVSAMRIGKQMQFFGARANLAKTLLYAINGGKDEKSGAQVAPNFAPIQSEILDYDEVYQQFDEMMEWLAGVYINSLNVIHYMHDKYSYERIEMALHDTDVHRTMATGIAGLSVAADSLSAIKYGQVRTIRDENGLVVDFETTGDYPKYGNNDPRVDDIAVQLVESFMKKLRKHQTYRNSEHTMSVLTITSNVVYGKKTGNTPDGRKAGEPFAPGANPMHGRDDHGALASLSSVAKLPYDCCKDGISNTFSIVPKSLGKEEATQEQNLVSILDGYALQHGHHLNINVFNRETLLDAMEHPEEYPQLTVRVSGYAVNFIKLTREQQLDVISRTFHESM
ncbi:formate C-acetyltransferase [Staphylococcus pseudintermedius]|uniref:formate C-acetyltransferase n=1 Tax=Staphylococcus pseudintermedius TaxID=283734 RepID=UPI0007AE8721|nr:formate C-acetyltransferase [Staphylococcus pseudintermedius]EGQ0326158.1 formate C-acetyltransferase [Staphylococcus pseudintermedius]EGQ0362559.1 formate C-acetyltransferase [Staphylococcus pseudintermedius]EGQ1294917.1 formate C-acetyltransferase [Staphylococcus pseudintermedius]EGQ1707876.1 formate C-acetyltransferase [Staphylococcus pseudintermedius]EGQ2674199.1 formate C-acetyltransferase [Staphylococcus pseudintermedius]